MDSLNTLLLNSEYFILNKTLIKKIGLESTLILSDLINSKKSNIEKEHFTIQLHEISKNTTLSLFKIKNAINNLYKKKLIDVIVKNNETINVKILHTHILSTLFNEDILSFKESTKSVKPSPIKNKRFKKPTLKELQEYFTTIGEFDESEIMFDYYESKGWKVGKSPMKCWKSAARNWMRRLKKTNDFPDHYDKKLELKFGNDVETLSQYHKHLKKLGWISTYSPSSGITWRKKK